MLPVSNKKIETSAPDNLAGLHALVSQEIWSSWDKKTIKVHRPKESSQICSSPMLPQIS